MDQFWWFLHYFQPFWSKGSLTAALPWDQSLRSSRRTVPDGNWFCLCSLRFVGIMGTMILHSSPTFQFSVRRTLWCDYRIRSNFCLSEDVFPSPSKKSLLLIQYLCYASTHRTNTENSTTFMLWGICRCGIWAMFYDIWNCKNNSESTYQIANIICEIIVYIELWLIKKCSNIMVQKWQLFSLFCPAPVCLSK